MFGIEKDFQKLMEKVYGPLGEKKQMTEELDPSRILKDNDFIWYMGEKYQKIEEPKTLKELFETYVSCGFWNTTPKEVVAQELVNIVKEIIPKPYKGMGLPEYSVGFNDCIRRIEENLK